MKEKPTVVSAFVGAFPSNRITKAMKNFNVKDGREVTVHPENTHLRLNISLQCTAQHAVQYKMVGWQQCAR